MRRLPEDVWLVDLDANRISGPSNAERDSCNFVPALPEPEASVLRNHLKQVCGDLNIIPAKKTIILNRKKERHIKYLCTFKQYKKCTEKCALYKYIVFSIYCLMQNMYKEENFFGIKCLTNIRRRRITKTTFTMLLSPKKAFKKDVLVLVRDLTR